MRNIKMDNLKGLLIVSVVAGHLLELCMGKGREPLRFLYICIYFFHMPLFVYCSGYFAKLTGVGSRILKKLLPPFILFQLLYILFERVVLKNELEIQFSKPYWILWYLQAVMIWSVLLPIVAQKSRKKQIIVLTFAIAAALFCGFDEEIGRVFSMSRVIVYFPFFLLGYDLHMWDTERMKLPEEGTEHGREIKTRKADLFAVRNKKMISTAVMVFLLGIIVVTGIRMEAWKVSWLYEAAAYEKNGSDMEFRLFHLAAGALGILAARRFVPDKKLPVFDKLGQKTMPIYLSHGFLIKGIDFFGIL